MMKRRILLATINADLGRFSLSIEFLAAKILNDPGLNRKIRLIKKSFPSNTSRTKIYHQIIRYSPHLIGFSCYVWNLTNILELASSIRNVLPRTLIVLGGPATAGIGERILEKYTCLDAVVAGEGEETFSQMIIGWLENERLDPIPGTIARQGKRVVAGPPRPPTKNLSKLPSPYDALKITAQNGVFELPFQTMRGCTRNCFYCYYGKNLPTIRLFSLKQIRNNLEKIRQAGFRSIGIIDPNLFCYQEHAKNIIRIISSKGLRFQAEANAEDLNDEAIELLAKSTCYQINIGLQSCNPLTLKLCGRSFNLKQFENNVRQLAKKAPDITLQIDLIYGLPGDTLDDFMNTLDFAFSLPIEGIHFFPLQALPGTPLFERPEKWGIRYNPNPPHMVYKSSTSFYEDKRQVPLSNCLLYWLSSAISRRALRYILDKIPHLPSQFFIRLIAWDRNGEKKFTDPKPINSFTLKKFHYLLSGVKHIYPGVFSAWEYDFIGEWARFKRYLERVEKKSCPGRYDLKISQKEGILWKRSNNHLIGFFRLGAKFSPGVLKPEPLKENLKRMLILKDFKGNIQCNEIPEGMENLLKLFGRPRTLESYLTAQGKESIYKRHAFLLYAREKGLIQTTKIPGTPC
jgi:radical SAM superfamily enzyme YgiQ (UPF0313 family)